MGGPPSSTESPSSENDGDANEVISFSFNFKTKSENQLPKVWSDGGLTPSKASAALADLNVNEESGSPSSAPSRLAKRIAETERLATALTTVISEQRHLIQEAVTATEHRLNEVKRDAVESAALAASRAIEERLKADHCQMLTAALNEAGLAAEAAKDTAVNAAIAATEMQCNEEKRAAVHEAVINRERELGHTQDEVVASAASMAFETANKSASAALASTQALQKVSTNKMQYGIHNTHLQIAQANGSLQGLLPEDAQQPRLAIRTQEEDIDKPRDEDLFFF
jgi:hypothetical protein|tara:strand:+ start:2621 stop:3469 length:849 start_codon:yes stop_codon:yes gene_type:complete